MYLARRRLSLVAVGIVLLFIRARPSSAQAQRALLTVDGLTIPAGGALAAFQIDTWGVIPLAVCKIPPEWEMKQEKFVNSAGFLAGRSDPYHRTLTKLDKIFLVDVYSYQPLAKKDHPASFAGWYKVFDGNAELLKERWTLHADYFHLTPASRCPDSPPAEP